MSSVRRCSPTSPRPDHHHEALALAGIEQRAADGIAGREGVKKAVGEPQ
jgi:hypothetical protein